MKEINLFNYKIYLSRNEIKVWLKKLNEIISHYSYAVIIVDTNTKKFCLPVLIKNGLLKKTKVIEISTGEKSKNIDTLQYILKELINLNIDRNSIIVNFGGGVLSDTGAFSASIFKRGIDYINIPTTLLSMVDASVGGKTGINFCGYKNIIGTFSEPKAIFIDTFFLKTLDSIELLSGLAEVIKYAIIADKDFFYELSNLKDLSDIDFYKIVSKSILIKKKIIENDFKEFGIRKVLNFGHSFAHAFESLSINNNFKITHGEAVAAGMICETALSKIKGILLDNNILNEISSLILKFYNFKKLKTLNFDSIYQVILKDKKNIANNILFSLIKEISNPVINLKCNYEEIKSAYKMFLEIIKED